MAQGRGLEDPECGPPEHGHGEEDAESPATQVVSENRAMCLWDEHTVCLGRRSTLRGLLLSDRDLGMVSVLWSELYTKRTAHPYATFFGSLAFLYSSLAPPYSFRPNSFDGAIQPNYRAGPRLNRGKLRFRRRLNMGLTNSSLLVELFFFCFWNFRKAASESSF